MIKKWRLCNFKSIYDETELDLRPLTIFAGANSSGKSTFIQSMLLVAQTLTNQVYSRPVILNGLGEFKDLASSGNNQDQISIGFTLAGARPTIMPWRGVVRPYYPHSHSNIESVSCDFSFSATGEPKVYSPRKPTSQGLRAPSSGWGAGGLKDQGDGASERSTRIWRESPIGRADAG